MRRPAPPPTRVVHLSGLLIQPALGLLGLLIGDLPAARGGRAWGRPAQLCSAACVHSRHGSVLQHAAAQLTWGHPRPSRQAWWPWGQGSCGSTQRERAQTQRGAALGGERCAARSIASMDAKKKKRCALGLIHPILGLLVFGVGDGLGRVDRRLKVLKQAARLLLHAVNQHGVGVVGGVQDGGVHVGLAVRVHKRRRLQVLLLNLASLGRLVAQDQVHLIVEGAGSRGGRLDTASMPLLRAFASTHASNITDLVCVSALVGAKHDGVRGVVLQALGREGGVSGHKLEVCKKQGGRLGRRRAVHEQSARAPLPCNMCAVVQSAARASASVGRLQPGWTCTARRVPVRLAQARAHGRSLPTHRRRRS